MGLGRKYIIYLACTQMARDEGLSFFDWCRIHNLSLTTLRQLSQGNAELTTIDKSIILILTSQNPKIYEYKERLLQMV